MQPIIMSKAIADATASTIEAAAHRATSPTIAYQLRLLMTMLRECPEGHNIVIDAAFSSTGEE